MDVVDKNPITGTLSGYENTLNRRCEWQRFVQTGQTCLCVCLGFLSVRVIVEAVVGSRRRIQSY